MSGTQFRGGEQRPTRNDRRRTEGAGGEDRDLRVQAREHHPQVVGEARDLGSVVLAVNVNELVCDR